MRGQFLFPVFGAFASDASAHHAERCGVFNALAGDGKVSAVDQMAMLVAEDLIAATFLDVVLNERVAFIGGALAIRNDGVSTGVLVAKLADVSGEVLVWLADGHLEYPRSPVKVTAIAHLDKHSTIGPLVINAKIASELPVVRRKPFVHFLGSLKSHLDVPLNISIVDDYTDDCKRKTRPVQRFLKKRRM
jgi:hypothetical protein